MRKSSLFFGNIGTVTVAAAAVNVKSLQTNVGLAPIDEEYTIHSLANIPKKQDLIGTYTVKDDKQVKLTLNDNGTYSLAINVCENYLFLSGNYELRDSKLILKNTNEMYDDLIGNEELSFTIINNSSISSDESLICTVQKTLFEK